MNSSSLKIGLTLLIALAGWSCASTSQVQEQSTSNTDREAIYRAHAENARTNYTQADVNFMIGMISHHAQALIMSRLAPENGASPQVQTLAARIINTQKGEIELMQSWLRRRGEPVPKVEINGLHLMIEMPEGEGHHSMGHDHSNMPGMLSQEQLEELAAATGAEFDRLFLEYMIQHHQGAVTMVKKLVSTPGAAQGDLTHSIVSGIYSDQTTEIDRMQRMLKRLITAVNES